MAFTRITDGDLQGKGVIGQPDVPGLSAREMQQSVEQIVREVAIPAVNRLAGELEAPTAAGSLGSEIPEGDGTTELPEGTPGTVGGVAAAIMKLLAGFIARRDNPHRVTAAQIGAYTKEETDAEIDKKVIDIGAADMTKMEYDPQRKGIDITVQTYTHTRSGNIHNFVGSGANGVAYMTANVQAGDTWAVNGKAVTAYMGADAATETMAGSAYSGKWVSFVVSGSSLNFKGGGGKVTVSGLAANKILQGTTVVVKQGARTVASAAGTIPAKGAATYRPTTYNQTIAAGQYLSGAQTIQGDPNLNAANIRAGVSVFGVAGKLTILACFSMLGAEGWHGWYRNSSGGVSKSPGPGGTLSATLGGTMVYARCSLAAASADTIAFNIGGVSRNVSVGAGGFVYQDFTGMTTKGVTCGLSATGAGRWCTITIMGYI